MLRRPRVLLVEDQLDLRDLIGNALADHGVDVVLAEDGRCAEELIRLHGDFDVVFSDIEMPNGVSGIELAETVARHLPRAQVILASGYARSQLPPLPEGVTFLSKPYRLKQLMALFNAVTRAEGARNAPGTDPIVSTLG
nr:response regulator [Pseudomonas corrugata]